MAAAGVPIWIDDAVRIAHAKTMVIDGAGTLIGSMNWKHGAAANSEDLNLVSSSEVAAAYAAHWRDNIRWSWCAGSKPGPPMRIRPIAISAAFAVGLATLPLSTAAAQSNPPQYYPACSPFPLEWPFCVAGAVLDIAATIVTVPIWLVTGVPPFGYYGPPYRPPPYCAPPYLRAGILRPAEFFGATLSPPVSRRWHSGSGIGGIEDAFAEIEP